MREARRHRGGERSEPLEIGPREAHARQREGALLIDVREAEELAAGRPAGAEHIPLGALERVLPQRCPDRSRPVVLVCAVGARSLVGARRLRELGYERAQSVAGGVVRWRREGLPLEAPAALTRAQAERYARHLVLPEVGPEGQARLLRSRVLVVGAGGLGSPAALYLAAAGVGTLGIVDADRVDLGNLQRQVLHDETRLGQPKALSAKRRLEALNREIEIVAHPERLDESNVERILSGYEIVLDGSDNFATRYLVNDACVRLGLPDIHGAIFRFAGQVGVFWPARPGRRGPCYRCLFPEPPAPGTAPPCAEAGVLGVLPGVIGTLQAVEAIKIALGIGEPLVGRLVLYDALAARFSELRVDPDPACPVCAGTIAGAGHEGRGGSSS